MNGGCAPARASVSVLWLGFDLASKLLFRDRQVVAADIKFKEHHLEQEIENDWSIALTEREAVINGAPGARESKKLQRRSSVEPRDVVYFGIARAARISW
jgi:hypothetical protein